MPRICIDVEHTRGTAHRLIAEGDRLAEIGEQLDRAIQRLYAEGWEGESRVQIEAQLADVQRRAHVLARELTARGQRLAHIADAFERADNEASQELGGISWSVLTPAAGGGLGRAWADSIQDVLAEVGFLGSFLGTVGALTIDLREFGESLWNWLRGHGWSTDHQIRDEEAARELQRRAEEGRRLQQEEEERRRQEEAQRQEEARRQEEERRKQEEVARAQPQSPAWWHNVPPLKQKKGSYECAPTAASMLLQYYHNQSTHNKALSPQEIIEGLGSRFNPYTGVAADKLVEGLRDMKLGYKTIEWKAKLDKEQLWEELEHGPVMAQVHLNLTSSGYPHMVVVNGISDDG
ncbi:MAG: WXG100 family type VII secretion target, partial [Anaerolineae bacterium]|nr:WXG100 family type VII secretion target [Anaerolineae bacterium]